MALRLSEGLLSGLRNFGQQPMTQLNQSLAQPVNPSQALASSLGGLFGVDMRSPAAVQQAQQQAQQEQLKSSVGAIKDPSSYEGMIQLAQAVMNIDPMQGAQLLAKAEEMKKAGMAQLDQGQREIETARQEQLRNENLRRSMASKLTEQGYNTLASLVVGGDQEAYTEGLKILSKGAGAGKELKGSPKDRGLYRDKAGNEYAAQQLTYSDGSSEIVYINQATGEQVNRLGAEFKRIGDLGETAEEEREGETGAAISQSRGQEWVTYQTDAIAGLPEVVFSLNQIKRAKNILETLPEGKLTAQARQSFYNFFGKRPTTDAEASKIIADQVMNTLQGFSGAISEGERAWAMEQGPQLSNDRNKNLGILAEMERRADLLKRKAEIMANSDSSSEYREKIREAGLLLDYEDELKKSKTGESFQVGNYSVKVKD
jgi:hypothetical protein